MAVEKDRERDLCDHLRSEYVAVMEIKKKTQKLLRKQGIIAVGKQRIFKTAIETGKYCSWKPKNS